MNRKIVLLNLVLLALAATLVWGLRTRWQQGIAEQNRVLYEAAQRPAVLVPPPPPPIEPAVPAAYLDVAARTLFAKDRNPDVVIAPPPPPPEPPVPPFPVYHGQMSLAKPVAVLSVGNGGPQKSYHVGDEVGEFTLVSFNSQTITFGWNGKNLEKKIEDLKPKRGEPEPDVAPPAAAVAPAAAPAISLSSPAKSSTALKSPEVGSDMGAGYRACVAGDNSPAGTVKDGYKKVVSVGLMGQACYWEQVK